MNFLFWNIRKKDSFFSTIKDIVNEEEIDVLILAEFPTDVQPAMDLLLKELVQVSSDFKYLKPNKKEKVYIFFRRKTVAIRNKYNGDYVFAKEIAKGERRISIVPCHLCSILGTNDGSLTSNSEDFCEDLCLYETKKVRHRYTVICGDFNMSPFDDGMIACKAFNATMDTNIANRCSRVVNKKDYGYFYNPMWNLLGDDCVGKTPGTYYFNNAKSVNLMWYMYDQVIMRPEVIPLFDFNGLKILTKGTRYNLLDTKGLLNKQYSDHLPLKFKINI